MRLNALTLGDQQPLTRIETNEIETNITQFQATQEQVLEIKHQMVEALSNLQNPDLKNQVAHQIIGAIVEKDIGEISESDPIWNPETRTESNRTFEARILSDILPEVKSLEDYTNQINKYLTNPEDLPQAQYVKGLDIFINSPGAHPYQSWVEIYCNQIGLDNARIALDPRNQHFYIKDHLPGFIPDDGDCAFHCIQSLIKVKNLDIIGTH